MTTRWTATQLAKALMLSVVRIGQLRKLGIISQTQGGYDPFVCIPAYLTFITKAAQPKSLEAAKIAKLNISTALQDLELKRRQGELLDRHYVDNGIFTKNHMVRDSLLVIQHRIGSMCVAAVRTEPDDLKARFAIEQLIEQEHYQALTSLGEGIPYAPAQEAKHENPTIHTTTPETV